MTVARGCVYNGELVIQMQIIQPQLCHMIHNYSLANQHGQSKLADPGRVDSTAPPICGYLSPYTRCRHGLTFM